MDFKAIIDLVKYTLALTAACFAYSLEKFEPAASPGERWIVLGLLATFFVAILAGIFIFSASTAALHGDTERAKRQEPRIMRAAYTHIGLLCIGILLLGGMVVERVLTRVPKPPAVCCTPAATKP